jgi:hypothetical protein
MEQVIMSRTLSLRSKVTVFALVGSLVLAAAVWIYILLSDPDDLTVSAGEKVFVSVVAESVEDLYGYQFRVNYNPQYLEFSDGLESDIGEIGTIFSKPFEGYELVGATMTGAQKGVDGKNSNICRMTLTALADCVISEEVLSLSDIRTVHSGLEYETDVKGWKRNVRLAE